jgi:hypothetical protein
MICIKITITDKWDEDLSAVEATIQVEEEEVKPNAQELVHGHRIRKLLYTHFQDEGASIKTLKTGGDGNAIDGAD